jgi:hypothetical protein
MGTVTVKIPHVTWRDGRPRFIPGTVLRKEGYKGRDLRHEDGRWFSLDEAAAWSKTLGEEIVARRAARAEGRRVQRPKPAGKALTVGQLVEQMLKQPAFRIIDDRRERALKEALAPKTIRWYRGIARAVEAYDAELWASPALAVSRYFVKQWRRDLVAAKGLYMARAMIVLLLRAFNEIDHLMANPFAKLKLAAPPVRLNAAEPEAIDWLVAAADATGRFDIGDSIMFGVCTGQRQNDRLALTEHARLDGAILFRQMKTGAVATIPPLDRLTVRMVAAKARRADHDAAVAAAGRGVVVWPNVLIDEGNWRPWEEEGSHYRRAFAAVRAHAIATGSPAIAEALAGFHDQDLRDTAVTWLARAGCTVPEICAVTGHSEQTAYTILKHYLGRHPELARNAMAKVSAWLDAYDGEKAAG